MSGGLEDNFRASCLRLLSGSDGKLLAVSGGGDSAALLRLAASARDVIGGDLSVATVDHGLRPESAHEAGEVGAWCRALGLRHAVLRWTGDKSGNMEGAAREARISLLSEHAKRIGAETVVIAHNRNDIAENALMRLWSNRRGFIGIAEEREVRGVRWCRPMLFAGRDEIRNWMSERGHPFHEDPMNHDEAFTRVRARNMILSGECDVDALVELAERSLDVASAEASEAAETARRTAAVSRRGVLSFSVASASDGAARFILSAASRLIGSDKSPRGPALMRALSSARSGAPFTLNGAEFRFSGDVCECSREPARAEVITANENGDVVWDGRWRVNGVMTGDVIRCQTRKEGAAPVPVIEREGDLIRPKALFLPTPEDMTRLCTPTRRQEAVLDDAPEL